MYKASIRALLRHSINKLNNGDYSLMLKLASPDFELAFPGENSWSTMFRPQQRGRSRHVTHRGVDEAVAFADRFVDEGIQFEIEDILVNGPPWNTRIALRVRDFVPGNNGDDVYNNRAVLFLEARWGRLLRWEDYEDTERVAAWDRATSDTTSPGHRDVR
jgi:ketosteroid isomerase-like protein